MKVELIPSIDIMKGKVVRLERGDPSTQKRYERLGTPLAVALQWEAEGAKRIHVVDLDAALGLGSNTSMITEIVHSTSTPIQVGGGIRTVEAARSLFKEGVDRVVLGSMAFENPVSLVTLLREYGPNHVVVALDHIDGRVVVHGWKKSVQLDVDEALETVMAKGVRICLVTSVDRDGLLQGPDIGTLSRLTRHGEAELLASGGVACIEDLDRLKKVGVRGVIIGKALCEGVFTLQGALNHVKEGVH